MKKAAGFNFGNLRVRFERGDKAAALQALAYSYYFGVMPPGWAVAHVLQGWQRWNAAEVRTLDEALEVQRPKGFSLDAENRAAQFGGAILLEVNKRWESEPFDDQFFEDAGRFWGIGKTTAKKIYYAEMKRLEVNHPNTHRRVMSSREKSKNAAVSRRKK